MNGEGLAYGSAPLFVFYDPCIGYQSIRSQAQIREREIVDEKQKRQVNDAAEKFADALRESYRSIADSSVSAQELNAQVTQEFFNGVISNLRSQADNNRALSEDLIEQQRRQQEASRALAQESVNAYMDFLGSMSSYYRGSLEEIQRRATL